MNKKYYIVHSKNLAISLSYITGEDFYTFDDKFDKNKKVYSFNDYDKLEKAMFLIQNAKIKFNN